MVGMCAEYPRSAPIAFGSGFSEVSEVSSKDVKVSGRGDATTSPGLAPKDSPRRDTQPNRNRLSRRISTSLPICKESDDGN